MDNLSNTDKALLGAIEMLTKISRGESFSALEFHTRLATYRSALLEARPRLFTDPYWSKAAFDHMQQPKGAQS